MSIRPCCTGPNGSSSFSCSALSLCSVGSFSDISLLGIEVGNTLVWDGTQLVPGLSSGSGECSFVIDSLNTETAEVTVSETPEGVQISVDVIGGVVGETGPCEFEVVGSRGLDVSGTGTPTTDPLVLDLSSVQTFDWFDAGILSVSTETAKKRIFFSDVEIVAWGISLITAGSTSTVVELLDDVGTIDTLTLVGGSSHDDALVSRVVNTGGFLDVAVSAVGDGAEGLHIQVLYKR